MVTRLTTLENVKAYGGIQDSANDESLDRLIDVASEYVATWCSREFSAITHSEVYDGTGNAKLVLRYYPVLSVQSLRIDGQTIPPRPAFNSNGYVVDDLKISLVGYRFTSGAQNIEVEYTAGFATVPPDLEQAAIELVLQRYRDANRVGLNSQSLGGENATFDVNSLSKFARSVLQQYKRVIPL